jgi:hypothetical protein
VPGREIEEGISEVTDDRRMSVAFLDVVFDGVDDAGEVTEPLNTEAVERPPQ